MRYLITPSLYGAYSYYKNTDYCKFCEDMDKAIEAEKKAYQDWLNTLNKVKTPTTEAQQKGIDFENAVQELCENYEGVHLEDEKLVFGNEVDFILTSMLPEAEAKSAFEIAKKVVKGIWQETLQKEVDNYKLYGRADVIKQNYIYDIKRVSQYDVGKYQKSIQHLLYMECADIDNFEYLIADKSGNIYSEYYAREPQEVLLSKIDEMVEFIKSVPEFYKPFNENWEVRDE